MLAEELLVIDAHAPLWQTARPLLDVALRLSQNDETYNWHGWHKHQMQNFLDSLPGQCSLVLGVWETVPQEANEAEHEQLVLGIVCEVDAGEVRSVRTFEALAAAGLKPVHELEPGVEDALEIMRIARTEAGPVAWALFMEKAAWDEWLFAGDEDGVAADKAEFLASLARQGRCVLMGSQVPRHR